MLCVVRTLGRKVAPVSAALLALAFLALRLLLWRFVSWRRIRLGGFSFIGVHVY